MAGTIVVGDSAVSSEIVTRAVRWNHSTVLGNGSVSVLHSVVVLVDHVSVLTIGHILSTVNERGGSVPVAGAIVVREVSSVVVGVVASMVAIVNN